MTTKPLACLFTCTRAGSAAATALAAALVLAACNDKPPPPAAPACVPVGRLTVTSANFQPGAALPIDETCDGKNTSPGLVWSTPPEGTRSIAIVVDDVDSTPAEFTHWLLFDLPPTLTKLPEAYEPSGSDGGTLGLNDFNNARYEGPCPPKGAPHRFRFRVLALDAPMALPSGADRATLDRQMNGHVLAEGLLKGTFSH